MNLPPKSSHARKKPPPLEESENKQIRKKEEFVAIFNLFGHRRQSSEMIGLSVADVVEMLGFRHKGCTAIGVLHTDLLRIFFFCL